MLTIWAQHEVKKNQGRTEKPFSENINLLQNTTYNHWLQRKLVADKEKN